MTKIDVSRETLATLDRYVAELVDENGRQNLIARGSVDDLWPRHIVDALQLLEIAPGPGSWCDIGSGAGLPGMVLAIAGARPMTLIEPRRLRADFLSRTVIRLDLRDVTIEARKVEAVGGTFDRITARAVASASRIFAMAAHLAHDETVWILPKGKSAQSELDEARLAWQGEFRLEPSATNEDARILVAKHVKRRGRR